MFSLAEGEDDESSGPALKAMQAYLDKNPEIVALIREMSDEEKRMWIDEFWTMHVPSDEKKLHDDDDEWPEETHIPMYCLHT